ncbi:response regulator transcription factor [Streptomyces sp. ET3-23]|uniref:response regulator transcription factor n=1 Tax=Streptomyces sp. ET3-23 TaxID=2885643 RepID=UPI001D0FDE21|nr:response regulator transcription factor [Streptomyces sp. ET3-23]MCC2280436.1 response regulator transcription factor [Streptomyces sp. ET3-23]
MPRLTILVAGETALLRDALTELLHSQPNMTVLAQAANESDLMRRAAALHPHVVVLEPWVLENALVRTVQSLHRLSPRPAVVTVSVRHSMADRRDLEAAGLHAYLPRDAGLDELLSTVRTLAPPAVRNAVRSPSPALTRRETEVLRGVASAMTNQQIGHSLGITTGTVKRHLHAAFKKLGAVSRLDAVTQALAAGLIAPPVSGLPNDTASTERAPQRKSSERLTPC